MKNLSFKRSLPASIGIELEFQLIDKQSCKLASGSKHLIRKIGENGYQDRITPEITQSMIELNSSIHQHPASLYKELLELQNYLLQLAADTDIAFCGGGTHPFQEWTLQKIFPTRRYKRLAHKFRYLTRRATVFGLHVHIGCETPANAIYLTHILARYVPQLIALSASSPFYQGIDSGFYSSRSTVFGAFPTSGVIPLLTNWEDFSRYFYRMKKWGVIESMKDIYWDIRPKPEFGTVEVRVCDTPLTLERAVNIAAFVQALAVYLWAERPIPISQEVYFLYNYNRFQASRYGFSGHFLNAYSNQETEISEDILNTITALEKYAVQLNTTPFLQKLYEEVAHNVSDVHLLREIYKKHHSFAKVVEEQCSYWLCSSRDKNEKP
ncbi:carboxylate-amine ligase (plasmid) [Legionella adelaidensis]|uniref:Putative glutamate--cysteine ligase 2 n=1 Tax=Legionella adelaidensis TaxID=45056 RepID=A0A0W0R1N1_9GAMM|nr:YbdK family carboxylate-amine ligase [Legionella adelaidensis]KTC64998.1 carboxylate-amine ligase [Legionella adelaidensis]VEH85322.1 carboxylate-amine ligase [Legionella adelaidensis]